MTGQAIPPRPLELSGSGAWRAEIRAMLALAWPLIVTNLTMSAIGASDVLMVGWLGAEELAATSLGFNLCMFAAIFAMGVITASAPMMASEIGRKRNSVRDLRRTFRQTLWVAAALMLPVWAILWNAETLLLWLGQIPELAAKAQVYVRVYMLAILPFLWLLTTRNFVSALERPVSAMLIGVAGVFANILFNYALIFGHFGFPALGILGAACASLLTNIAMFLGMAALLMRDRQFRRYRLFGHFWRADWPRFAALWRLGLPIGVTFGLEGGVFSIAVMLMGWIDTISVAAHAIALQIAALTFMVPMGLGQAATVRVGIGHGRQDADLITRAGWTAFALGTGFMTCMAVMIWSFPVELASLFLDRSNPQSGAVLAMAVQFLALAALFQIFDGAQVVGAGMLRGLHDTRVPMLFAAFGYWVVGIGVGTGLAFGAGWQGVGIWTGLASGLAMVAMLMLGRWIMRGRLGLMPAAA